MYLFALLLLAVCLSSAAILRVTVENLAPTNGTFITPVWVAFHDGTFDIYDQGVAASTALERLAEDGDTSGLAASLLASGAGAAGGTLGSGPIGPGGTVTAFFTLDASATLSRFFSYASMVVPSNDAFIANGNPMANQAFSVGGTFMPVNITVSGSMVLDAGTEVNDELPANTAFFGQTTPNTGVDENGVVMIHAGLQAASPGNILADPMFAAADFTAPGYTVARITVEEIPEPDSLFLFATGLAGLAVVRRLSS